jgi:hypothetical protein
VIRIAKDDVLRGLKKFKRLAKQDLLASSLTSNPHYWSTQAEARRAEYGELMEIVDDDGVEIAYRKAVQRYASLPLVAQGECPDPEVSGCRQALEMFFTMLGVSAEVTQSDFSVPMATGALS